MGNYMELWGGTPRAHVGVQFYRRAMWCLESAIFIPDDDNNDDENLAADGDDDDDEDPRAEGPSHYLPYETCSLMFQTLDELPEEVDLDALLLTTYVHIQRALAKSGRYDEAAMIESVMEDSLDEEKLALKTKVGGMLNGELIRLMTGTVTPR
uniref:Uncharacterized protein n=1 Tax=Lotharella oceanica TaxID=641309 RepID=A0A7S2TH39_9EUKA|mmetsp:Transcript_14010/g.26734  ORF Transcript_14010/g.26734 Transcript_14010/m.26734 type:complete len:153 (+) Transcript_14010:30-488(+)